MRCYLRLFALGASNELLVVQGLASGLRRSGRSSESHGGQRRSLSADPGNPRVVDRQIGILDALVHRQPLKGHADGSLRNSLRKHTFLDRESLVSSRKTRKTETAVIRLSVSWVHYLATTKQGTLGLGGIEKKGTDRE